MLSRLLTRALVFGMCLFATVASAQTTKLDAGKKELVTTRLGVSFALESTEAAPLALDGQLSGVVDWAEQVSASFGIGMKNGSSLDLSSCYIGWRSGIAYANAGYLKARLGPRLFRSSTGRLGASNGITDVIADEMGFVSKDPSLSLGLEYHKNGLPLSANLAIRYQGEGLWPAACLSLAFHFDKRDGLLALSGAVLPLQIADPVNGTHIDLHAMGSLFVGDFESALVWSIEAATGTLPNPTPWSFPDYAPAGIVVWGAGEITAGYRIDLGEAVLLPGIQASARIPDLSSPGQAAIRAVIGARCIPFKGMSLWLWGGVAVDDLGNVPGFSWDAGTEIEL